MALLIFLLVYLISFAIHVVVCYFEYKKKIRTVGDLISRIEVYMWFPLLNTCIVIGTGLLIGIINIAKLLKLDIVWEKFKNIKLK